MEIDLTNSNDDDEISYLEELKAILAREDFTMRQKETLLDQIISKAKENIRLQKSKVEEMQKEYDAMTSIYGPVKDQMEKDEASDRLCQKTVESFDKIGKGKVEVDKVHVFFKTCNLVLKHRGFQPGNSHTLTAILIYNNYNMTLYNTVFVVGSKAVIKRKLPATCLETGEATEQEKENMDNMSS